MAALSGGGCLPIGSSSSSKSSRSLLDSPDNDSAFSDNGSMISCSDSNSASSGGGGSSASTQRKVAAHPMLSVKIFCADGSTKSLLLDRPMSAADVLDILVEENHVQLQPSWGVVENLSDLYMERCLEDDESVVEMLLSWPPEAKNKLFFVSRPERYDLFRRPEKYLLGFSSSRSSRLLHPQQQTQWDQRRRQALLEEVFSLQDSSSLLEMEGPLWLKSEGKKSWKKFHFILLRSGLFYVPHGSKNHISPEEELACLVASFDAFQVYFGINWKKKHKSPTESCFALRPPQPSPSPSPSPPPQGATCAKGSVHAKGQQIKEIRYLCAENDALLHQWVAAIRIVKNRRQLLHNYNCLLAKMQTGTGKEGLYAALRHRECSQQRQQRRQRQDGCSLKAWDAASSELLSGDSGSCSTYSSSSSSSVSNGCNSEKVSSSSSYSSSKHHHCQQQYHEAPAAAAAAAAAGFDTDFPEGGTIRRKPQQQQKDVSAPNDRMLTKNFLPSSLSHVSPKEPLRQTESMAIGCSSHLGDSNLSLNSLPPPPEELQLPLRFPSPSNSGSHSHNMLQQQHSAPREPTSQLIQFQSSLNNSEIQQNVSPKQQQQQKHVPFSSPFPDHQASLQSCTSLPLQHAADATRAFQLVSPIREQLYPCGVFRAVLPSRYPEECSQKALLRHLPDNPPPLRLFCLPSSSSATAIGAAAAAAAPLTVGPRNHLEKQQQLLPDSTAAAAAADSSSSSSSSRRYTKKGVTFNEVVEHINLGTSEPLKSAAVEGFAPLTNSIRNSCPGRLFVEEGNSGLTTGQQQQPPQPSRAFLGDLQRVMQRKWAVAQKFHSNGGCEEETAERFANHYNEREVSKWILQSLKHSHIQETDMTQDLCNIDLGQIDSSCIFTNGNGTSSLPPRARHIPHEHRPRIYNGRCVPNCFPPSNEQQQLNMISTTLSSSLLRTTSETASACASAIDVVPLLQNTPVKSQRVPPVPPKRSGDTQLTSPI